MGIHLKNISTMKKDAAEIFFKGLQAVEPGAAVKRCCKLDGESLFVGNRTYHLPQYKNLFVIGAGKATAPMAAALEDILEERISEGIIIVKYDHLADLQRINLIEAGHPLPDPNGEKGADAILNLAKKSGKDDLIFCLISGGGSALLPLPFNGITLNLRKHTSKIKGGRLAQAAFPATIISLILSDVVGDDLDIIASGPTVPDSSSFADCMEILERYHIKDKIPESILNHIESGISGKTPETPKADDPAFKRTQNLIIASNIESLMAAKEKAERLQYNVILLSSMIVGETRYAAQIHGAIAKEIIKTGNPISPPACILSGGETTVTISGNGLGGRNQEFALAAAIDISGHKNVVVLSGGTDGTDGPTDAAGAFSDTYTLERAKEMGLNPHHFLANNDAYHFFEKLDDLLITGPTNTNVMDLRILLVVDVTVYAGFK
ncbi:MAG: glycerate kinase [Deltaproteobacteria bacterium]|nr:glycerate kinase [Deltaproteobacteria bacterium]